jgi:hypothetical protein
MPFQSHLVNQKVNHNTQKISLDISYSKWQRIAGMNTAKLNGHSFGSNTENFTGTAQTY